MELGRDVLTGTSRTGRDERLVWVVGGTFLQDDWIHIQAQFAFVLVVSLLVSITAPEICNTDLFKFKSTQTITSSFVT